MEEMIAGVNLFTSVPGDIGHERRAGKPELEADDGDPTEKSEASGRDGGSPEPGLFLARRVFRVDPQQIGLKQCRMMASDGQ
jgi:hypothetical protein